MTRFSRLVNAFSWKYAIGEVLLIVIGITIALAANSYYSDWQDRLDEIEILEQILTSLRGDREEFLATFESYKKQEQELIALRGYIQGQLPYRAVLDEQFGQIGVFDYAYLDMAGYEVLRSRGLDLVSSFDLRVALTGLYEQQNTIITRRIDISAQQTLAWINNYVIGHFKDIGFGKITPIDYDALLEDRVFHAYLDYKIGVLINLNLRDYGRALKQIESVISRIEIELKSQ